MQNLESWKTTPFVCGCARTTCIIASPRERSECGCAGPRAQPQVRVLNGSRVCSVQVRCALAEWLIFLDSRTFGTEVRTLNQSKKYRNSNKEQRSSNKVKCVKDNKQGYKAERHASTCMRRASSSTSSTLPVVKKGI